MFHTRTALLPGCLDPLSWKDWVLEDLLLELFFFSKLLVQSRFATTFVVHLRQIAYYWIMKTEQPYLNRLLLYFFRGLLLVAPLGATLYLISVVLQKIDGLASFGIPGLGMFIVASSITLLGYIGSTLLVQSAFGFTEALIKKLPFVSMLYTSLKDFTSAFVSSKGKFDKPVIVLVDKTIQAYRIGFLTKESLEILSMPDHVAVYFPNSYDLAGTLMLVAPELVRPLDLPSSEVMKFILSGAVTPLKTTPTTDDLMDLDGVE